MAGADPRAVTLTELKKDAPTYELFCADGAQALINAFAADEIDGFADKSLLAPYIKPVFEKYVSGPWAGSTVSASVENVLRHIKDEANEGEVFVEARKIASYVPKTAETAEGAPDAGAGAGLESASAGAGGPPSKLTAKRTGGAPLGALRRRRRLLRNASHTP